MLETYIAEMVAKGLWDVLISLPEGEKKDKAMAKLGVTAAMSWEEAAPKVMEYLRRESEKRKAEVESILG